MLTFTLQHQRGDLLADVLAALLGAYKLFRNGRWWMDFQQSFGVVGTIRGLEVTYGDNGWHPHIHLMCFYELPIMPVGALEFATKTRWGRVVAKCGKHASWDYGIDVRVSEDLAREYVAKFGSENVSGGWDLAHEIAKAPAKLGRRGGRSPLQLLADCADGDHDAGLRWLEFTRCFKGQRQLVWSSGLRELLAVGDDLTDEEIAVKVDQDAILLASLTRSQWARIVGNDARGELLEAASAGIEALREFLVSLGVHLGDDDQ